MYNGRLSSTTTVHELAPADTTSSHDWYEGQNHVTKQAVVVGDVLLVLVDGVSRSHLLELGWGGVDCPHLEWMPPLIARLAVGFRRASCPFLLPVLQPAPAPLLVLQLGPSSKSVNEIRD